jgi:hypothetical protein
MGIVPASGGKQENSFRDRVTMTIFLSGTGDPGAKN